MYNRKSPLTCWEKVEDSATKFGIFVLNIIDFFMGCFFLSFGVYLHIKLGSELSKSRTSWIAILSISIGIALLSIVFFSFTSINLTDCKIGVVVSGYIALLISITSLAVGIGGVVMKRDIFHYLEDNHVSLGIEESDVETIKDWYNVVLILLFISWILEFIRFHWSHFLYKNYGKIEVKFQRLLDLEQEEYEVQFNSRQADRTEKYDSLRTHYKTKYAESSARDGSL